VGGHFFVHVYLCSFVASGRQTGFQTKKTKKRAGKMSPRIAKNEQSKRKRLPITGMLLGALVVYCFIGGAGARAQSAAMQPVAAPPAQSQQVAASALENSEGSGADASAKVEPAQKPKQHTPIAVGVGVKTSLLGVGVEAAVPITRRANARIAYNQFNYSDNLTSNGINYGSTLDLRSVEALYDWFPFGGRFHLSPGLLAYNGNQLKANASVAGGDTFTLNHTTYSSSPSDPVTGTGKLQLGNKVAPMFLVGWGNLAPRRGHFSFSIETGAAFEGAPVTTLNLKGSACDFSGANCVPVATDPGVQSNVKGEQARLNHDVSPFKLFPVVSLGFGYKF
jgi:hypothetical protein